MSRQEPVPKTQGNAVKQAIEGDRNDDIDRWRRIFRAEKARAARGGTAPPMKPAECRAPGWRAMAGLGRRGLTWSLDSRGRQDADDHRCRGV